jgi:hypothetical protein
MNIVSHPARQRQNKRRPWPLGYRLPAGNCHICGGHGPGARVCDECRDKSRGITLMLAARALLRKST